MLEYTTAGDARRLGMLLLHDDEVREYGYGPANGLPDSAVGTFPTSLVETAKAHIWIVISMQHDWRRIFAVD